MRPSHTRDFAPWIAGLLLSLSSGCGNQDPQLFPARGKVLFHGKPIPKAEMLLHPLFDGPGWMPVAVVGEDGAFEVSTKKPGDGALAGRYKVTVVWRPTARDDQEGPNLLPPRYSQVATSDWEMEVGPGAEDLATFELKN